MSGPRAGTERRGSGTGAEAGDAGSLTSLEEELRGLAGSVPDPELPVLTLEELGVLRAVQVLGPGRVEVELTPTYTGCPAIETMARDIERVLHEHGTADVTVKTVLSPPWTTDDITDEGRRKLRESGIAPPRTERPAGPVPLVLGPTRTSAASCASPAIHASDSAGTTGPAGTRDHSMASASVGARRLRTEDSAPGHDGLDSVPFQEPVCCPYCGSAETELLSRFSSTACKALRRCLACREPFDHFKEL